MSVRSKVFAALLTVGLMATTGWAQSGASAHSGGMGFGQHVLNFYTDYLDLTDAQQAQVKAIMTKEKPIMEPMLQQLAQTHQQLEQLENSSTFDEAKVRAVAAQQTQTMTDLIVEKARAKSEMVQLLTPDQKTKLQKLEARREQRMLNHLSNPQPSSE